MLYHQAVLVGMLSYHQSALLVFAHVAPSTFAVENIEANNHNSICTSVYAESTHSSSFKILLKR